MFRKGWRKRASLVWMATFETAAATYVTFGRNKAELPVYRHDRSRRIVVPTNLTYPSCFQFIPTALMTSRLKRRRLESILEEYGTVIGGSGTTSVGTWFDAGV